MITNSPVSHRLSEIFRRLITNHHHRYNRIDSIDRKKNQDQERMGAILYKILFNDDTSIYVLSIIIHSMTTMQSRKGFIINPWFHHQIKINEKLFLVKI